MNERLSLSAFIITLGQKGQRFYLTFLMYILPNKTNKLYDFSPSYKEENIHITTNSIFALIFSYGGYIQWGILKNLENLSDQDHSI